MRLATLFASDIPEVGNFAGVAACFVVLFFPLGICGVLGIIAAFRRRRRMALQGGLYAGIPAVVYYALLCPAVLNTSTAERSDPDLAWLFCSGIFPLAAGFWAILLAYLIPEKPSADDPF
jgi:hypothetical protein